MSLVHSTLYWSKQISLEYASEMESYADKTIENSILRKRDHDHVGTNECICTPKPITKQTKTYNRRITTPKIQQTAGGNFKKQMILFSFLCKAEHIEEKGVRSSSSGGAILALLFGGILWLGATRLIRPFYVIFQRNNGIRFSRFRKKKHHVHKFFEGKLIPLRSTPDFSHYFVLICRADCELAALK